MFSGGEPTIHHHILRHSSTLAQARPINAVNLNTNGIRLASDTRFVAELGRRNRPGRPVNIYLQFDGLEAKTHLDIRGRDLRDIKRRALDNCAEAGLTVTLVAAVERDVNDHELGAIIRYGIAPSRRAFGGVSACHPCRSAPGVRPPRPGSPTPTSSTASPRSCPDWFRADDFFPVPCCFPDLPLDHLPDHRRRARGPDPATPRRRGLPGLRRATGWSPTTRSAQPSKSSGVHQRSWAPTPPPST